MSTLIEIEMLFAERQADVARRLSHQVGPVRRGGRRSAGRVLAVAADLLRPRRRARRFIAPPAAES